MTQIESKDEDERWKEEKQKETQQSIDDVSVKKDETIFCSKCGEQNPENNFKCTRCGFVLHGQSQPQYVVTDDNTMGGLIPFKNAKALWAYYLGIFSLIPCIGIPLGIASLVFGLKGLKYAELHPEAKGKAHAWTGIILGVLCSIGYTLLILIPLMMGAFK
jgi:hypothetical protein